MSINVDGLRYIRYETALSNSEEIRDAAFESSIHVRDPESGRTRVAGNSSFESLSAKIFLTIAAFRSPAARKITARERLMTGSVSVTRQFPTAAQTHSEPSDAFIKNFAARKRGRLYAHLLQHQASIRSHRLSKSGNTFFNSSSYSSAAASGFISPFIRCTFDGGIVIAGNQFMSDHPIVAFRIIGSHHAFIAENKMDLAQIHGVC